MLKAFKVLLALLILNGTAYSQDIVVKGNGDIIRATILGTDYLSVKYSVNEGQAVITGIKDLKSFVWNGETYIIKTFFGKKKAEDRFVRVVETGKVNLYAIGGNITAAAPAEPRVKIRPSFGVGVGSGGLGGGIGGSINIGGGRKDTQQSAGGPSKTYFFIEKPGTGSLQEINPADAEKTKALLLQKLGDDADLASRLKATDEFNGKSLIAFVKAYNEGKK